MAKNTKQSFEFNRTERLRRTIFLEDSSEDESLEYTNRTNTSNYSVYFQKLNYNKYCIRSVLLIPTSYIIHLFALNIIKNLNAVLFTVINEVQSLIK